MRLAQRNGGGWVLVARLRSTGQECEAPFEVTENANGFSLWGYGDDDELHLIADRLGKKAVIDHAETRLPPEWVS